MGCITYIITSKIKETQFLGGKSIPNKTLSPKIAGIVLLSFEFSVAKNRNVKKISIYRLKMSTNLLMCTSFPMGSTVHIQPEQVN